MNRIEQQQILHVGEAVEAELAAGTGLDPNAVRRPALRRVRGPEELLATGASMNRANPSSAPSESPMVEPLRISSAECPCSSRFHTSTEGPTRL